MCCVWSLWASKYILARICQVYFDSSKIFILKWQILAYEHLLMLSEVTHSLRIIGQKKIPIGGKGTDICNHQEKIKSEIIRVHTLWECWDLLWSCISNDLDTWSQCMKTESPEGFFNYGCCIKKESQSPTQSKIQKLLERSS